MPAELMQNLLRKNILPHQRNHQIGERRLPFFTMRIDTISQAKIDSKVRNFMNVCLKKEVRVQVIIERDPRVTAASLAGEVAHFCIAASRNLQLKRTLLP